MTSPTRHRYVVILGRGAGKAAPEIAAALKALPGVEVLAESASFVDLTADDEALTKNDLDGLVKKLGGELHRAPEAQLMDPIPPREIP